jgi:hypothetical protein
LIPSTILTLSGVGEGRDAGPANLDPNMICGVGGLPAPVVRPDSSSILDAISCCFSDSEVISGKGLDVGGDPTGC